MTEIRRSHLLSIVECSHFFGMSKEWVIHHERIGSFRDENKKKITAIRFLSPEGRLGTRYYTLEIIEAMTHSLKREKVISKYQWERIINLINAYRKVQEYAKTQNHRNKYRKEVSDY